MIDLCVVSYNTRPLLQRFLNTLHSDLSDSEKNWNLYIADNDSSDDTRDWISNHSNAYQISGYVENSNVGYSSACNQLASMGSSDIICLLNADVWLKSNDINKVKALYESDDSIHILGPKQRDENGYITHAGIVGTNLSPKHRGWREHDPHNNLYIDRIECVTVSGSAYFIRRDVWDSLSNNSEYKKIFPDSNGAFLPTPHYYEETWCSYFARHLGYNVHYDGSISIGHSWHKSSEVGGHADSYFSISREIFRKACDHFKIERD